MNIVRQGPKHLILESKDCAKLKNDIQNNFKDVVVVEKSEDMYEDFIRLIGLLDDHMTIIMLTSKMKEKLSVVNGDMDYIVVIHDDLETLLVNLLQKQNSYDIDDVRLTPNLLIMRTTGDVNAYISAVKKDLECQEVSTSDVLENHSSGTVVYFSDQSITAPVLCDDIHEVGLFVNEHTSLVIKQLNRNRVRYVNASVGNKEWTALTIKIYDSYEEYELHYKRLVMVLNELDSGLILGESWGKDAALAFHSVDVYQIKLFTYLEPNDIKSILLGLEYNQKGHRIVDYDLFKKRRKVDWTKARINDIKDRDQLGQHYRTMLSQKISEKIMFDLLSIEQHIKGEA